MTGVLGEVFSGQGCIFVIFFIFYLLPNIYLPNDDHVELRIPRSGARNADAPEEAWSGCLQDYILTQQ